MICEHKSLLLQIHWRKISYSNGLVCFYRNTYCNTFIFRHSQLFMIYIYIYSSLPEMTSVNYKIWNPVVWSQVQQAVQFQIYVYCVISAYLPFYYTSWTCALLWSQCKNISISSTASRRRLLILNSEISFFNVAHTEWQLIRWCWPLVKLHHMAVPV